LLEGWQELLGTRACRVVRVGSTIGLRICELCRQRGIVVA